MLWFRGSGEVQHTSPANGEVAMKGGLLHLSSVSGKKPELVLVPFYGDRPEGSPYGRCTSRRVKRGEVAEWSKAPVSKTGIRATGSGVRISPSPPVQKQAPIGAIFVERRGASKQFCLRGRFERHRYIFV